MRTPSTPLSLQPPRCLAAASPICWYADVGGATDNLYTMYTWLGKRRRTVHLIFHIYYATCMICVICWCPDLVQSLLCNVPERLHKLDYFAKMLCRCAQMVEICAKAGVCFWAHPAFSREKIPLVTQFKLAPSFSTSSTCPLFVLAQVYALLSLNHRSLQME